MAAWLVEATGAVLVASSVGFVWGFYQPRHERWAAVGLGVVWVLATVWLGRTLGLSQPSLTAPAVVGTLAVWMAAAGFPWWSRRPGWAPLAGFAVPVLTLWWAASQVVAPGLRAAAGRASLWEWAHLALLAAAMTSLLLGAAAAGMYLEHERELRQKAPRVFYYRLPPLGDLDRWSYRLTVWGWVSLSGCMVTGGLLTAPAGVYWVETTGAVGMLAVWLAYLIYVVLRARGWRGHGSSWVAVAAFVALAVDVVGGGGVSHGVAAAWWQGWYG